MIARNRIQLAAAFIAQLHRLSSNSPRSWRRATSVGRGINLDGAALELAIRDAEKAGFIQRRADDEGLIILTAKGQAAASAS
jgi:DNA-binding MarR family transcriptional regulator